MSAKFPTNDDIRKLKQSDKKRDKQQTPEVFDNANFIDNRSNKRRKMSIKTGKYSVLEPYRKLELNKLFKRDTKKGK